MKKILLTGFEPFLDYKINPTMTVAKELDGKTIEDYEIESFILPVDFNQSEKLLIEKMEQLKPDIVVSLGLAAGRYKITPERIAINVKDGDRDNNGFAPLDQLINSDGPDAYFSTLPVRSIINKLIENGFPAEISNTAGTYLCNNIMYSVLNYIKVNNLHCKAGFIHIPACHELAIIHGKIPSWSKNDLTSAIKISLEVIAKEGD